MADPLAGTVERPWLVVAPIPPVTEEGRWCDLSRKLSYEVGLAMVITAGTVLEAKTVASTLSEEYGSVQVVPLSVPQPFRQIAVWYRGA